MATMALVLPTVIPHSVRLMTISISRLTRKYQATIPEAVREKLDLHAGDVVAFCIAPISPDTM